MQTQVVVDFAELVGFNLVEGEFIMTNAHLRTVEKAGHILHQRKREILHYLPNYQYIVGIEAEGILVGHLDLHSRQNR